MEHNLFREDFSLEDSRGQTVENFLGKKPGGEPRKVAEWESEIVADDPHKHLPPTTALLRRDEKTKVRLARLVSLDRLLRYRLTLEVGRDDVRSVFLIPLLVDEGERDDDLVPAHDCGIPVLDGAASSSMSTVLLYSSSVISMS